jgi:hypothetical protein
MDTAIKRFNARPTETQAIEPIFRQSPYEFDGTALSAWQTTIEGSTLLVPSGHSHEVVQLEVAAEPVDVESE